MGPGVGIGPVAVNGAWKCRVKERLMTESIAKPRTVDCSRKCHHSRPVICYLSDLAA